MLPDKTSIKTKTLPSHNTNNKLKEININSMIQKWVINSKIQIQKVARTTFLII